MLYLKIILFIIIILSVYSFLSLAPWVPTRKKDFKRINDIIKLKPRERFLEVWCWTATVSLYIAQKNPESEIIWIELSPLFFLISRLKVLFNTNKNIKIIYWNALKINFGEYDVIYVFWLPDTIKNKLFSKLKKEMKNTASFISYCFKMENDYFKEEKYIEKNNNNIYCYNK